MISRYVSESSIESHEKEMRKLVKRDDKEQRQSTLYSAEYVFELRQRRDCLDVPDKSCKSNTHSIIFLMMVCVEPPSYFSEMPSVNILVVATS